MCLDDSKWEYVRQGDVLGLKWEDYEILYNSDTCFLYAYYQGLDIGSHSSIDSLKELCAKHRASQPVTHVMKRKGG